MVTVLTHFFFLLSVLKLLLNVIPVQFHIGPSIKRDGRAKRTEVTAEFQRLNVLLLRAVTGRRIGTALLTDARVQATLSQAVTASGMSQY